MCVGKALQYIKNKPQFFGGAIAVDEPVHRPGLNAAQIRASSNQTEIFFRKLYRVAHSRMINLCTELSITNDIAQKVR